MPRRCDSLINRGITEADLLHSLDLLFGMLSNIRDVSGCRAERDHWPACAENLDFLHSWPCASRAHSRQSSRRRSIELRQIYHCGMLARTSRLGTRASKEERMSTRTVVLRLVTFFCLTISSRLVLAQRPVEPVPGTEYTTGANLPGKNVKAEGTIFVPDKASYVRAVIVQVERRPLSDLAVGPFRDPMWRALAETSECALLHLRLTTIRPEASADQLVMIRDAAAGGADAILAMMQLLGEKSARRELKEAPLLLWGSWRRVAS